MTLWLDAHISPSIANWIRKEFRLEVWHLRDLGLLEASDGLIFEAARSKEVVFVTKDSDFAAIQAQRGSPPQIILLGFGNTSNQNLKLILATNLAKALDLITQGEILVEIQE